jgi:release factor glutamine methyltransferase
MSTPVKTLRELITLAAGFMEAKGVPDAHTVAELLIARLYSSNRSGLYKYLDQTPSERVVEAMRRGMRRVIDGEPVQYVIGEWDFRLLTLKTDRRALIPRPETEQLVELVLKSELAKRTKPLVVDVGTGSGCIILSLAKEMRDGVFVGLDVSPDALALACENAKFTGLDGRVLFVQSDGCGELDAASVDIIVSNPPYIPTQTVDLLDPRIRNWEPRLALDGGADGLDVYRTLLVDATMVLKPGGGLFFEIGDDQRGGITALLEDFGFVNIQVLKDYSGRDRFATAIQGM